MLTSGDGAGAGLFGDVEPNGESIEAEVDSAGEGAGEAVLLLAFEERRLKIFFMSWSAL